MAARGIGRCGRTLGRRRRALWALWGLLGSAATCSLIAPAATVTGTSVADSTPTAPSGARNPGTRESPVEELIAPPGEPLTVQSEGQQISPLARKALDEALAALRALGHGALCRGCGGSGTVVRRQRVGWHHAGGGLRLPIHANVEGTCASCEGDGCAPAARLERLVRAAADRLRAVPEAAGLRAKAVIAAQETLHELLDAGGPGLARRTQEMARGALRTATEHPVDALIVLPPRSGRGRGEDARARSSGALAAPDGAPDVVELHGVRVRIAEWPARVTTQESWVALLGRLESRPRSDPSATSGGSETILATLAAGMRPAHDPMERRSGRAQERAGSTGSGEASRRRTPDRPR